VNYILLITGASDLVIGALSVGLAIPLVKHKVKMNRTYGVRIRKAYSSPENWEKINEYGGRALIYWSIPIFVMGIGIVMAGAFIPNSELKPPAWMLMLPLTGILGVGALIQTILWSRNLPD
jgi:hypothetical protein